MSRKIDRLIDSIISIAACHGWEMSRHCAEEIASIKLVDFAQSTAKKIKTANSAAKKVEKPVEKPKAEKIEKPKSKAKAVKVTRNRGSELLNKGHILHKVVKHLGGGIPNLADKIGYSHSATYSVIRNNKAVSDILARKIEAVTEGKFTYKQLTGKKKPKAA